MFVGRAISFVVSIMLIVVGVSAVDQDPMRDIQIGMQGLAEASKDPEMLAQLMKDMQDPEMWAEAQKMMADPNFQKKMKEMTKGKEYQEAVKKTQEAMKDPTKAAHAEAKIEHMAKVGGEKLKKNAANAMQQAMDALESDPSAMAEMMKMVSDPQFKETMANMAKDSQFQQYIDAMKDMMQDPAQRQRMADISSTVKAKL